MLGRVIILCVVSACCHTSHTPWSGPAIATPAPVPVYQCGLNQVYAACAPGCGKVNITCEDLQRKRNCGDQTADDKCRPICICKEGFYRNANYECVPEEYCYKCAKPNEVFACGSACDSECSALGKACDIVNIVCNEKCYCKNGYARNSQRDCVPYSQCPGAPTCNTDEEYACHRTCPPITCQTHYATYFCRELPTCTFRCECKGGLLRASNKECVTTTGCLSDLREILSSLNSAQS